MYTIKENIINTYEIKKSKFITLIYKVNTIEEIDDLILKIKDEYKTANHYCYAYILDNNIRFSDDKEPSGTAGLPILNVLKKNNLNHVLCIVVRYFGGIKLGAGGLLRAYSKSVSDSIKDIIPLKKYINIIITFKYELENEINNLLNDYILNNRNYNELVTYDLNIEIDKYEEIKNKLESLTKIKKV